MVRNEIEKMKIIQADHMGMCFGVRDAIARAQEVAEQESVTVLGQLVHNATVVDRMRANGVQFASHPEDVTTRTALITAHGASDKAMNRARSAGLGLVDTTCPLVAFAHRGVRELVGQGYHPIIIGKRGHVEVNGMTEDLEFFDIVLTREEIERLEERPRFGVCSQTTQPIDRVERLVGVLRERFPDSDIRFIDTVCQPTKQRQAAAVDLAEKCNVVVVVGGSNSNNTRELVETCRSACRRVYHVQCARDLRREWFDHRDTVGLTAGTSTPDDLIQGVYAQLERLSRVDTLCCKVNAVGERSES